MALNVAALALFVISFVAYYQYWTAPAEVGSTLGIVLATIGVVLTVAAGFQGWVLIQHHHIGIQLTPDQQRLERATRPTTLTRPPCTLRGRAQVRAASPTLRDRVPAVGNRLARASQWHRAVLYQQQECGGD
ncbi:MAG: hypothetical protein ACRDS0_04020 [Pseudonocardiaceae bacterium]